MSENIFKIFESLPDPNKSKVGAKMVVPVVIGKAKLITNETNLIPFIFGMDYGDGEDTMAQYTFELKMVNGFKQWVLI